MLQQLINHSLDLRQLYDEGFDLEIINGRYLLCHQVPYVTLSKEIKRGTLACILTLASTSRTSRPSDHTIYFIGETPCDPEGLPLNAIINNSNRKQLYAGVWANFYFSSKPKCGYYENYYDKIKTYIQILSSQAYAIDNTVTARVNSHLIPQ